MRRFVEANLDFFSDDQTSGPLSIEEAVAYLSPRVAPDLGAALDENDARYRDVTDTAEEVRALLKSKFGGTKFSVRSQRYSGGQSVTIAWTDGPAEHLVEQTIGHLEGRKFDSSDDSTHFVTTDHVGSNGEIVKHQHTAWLHTVRHFSKDFLTEVAAKVAAKMGMEPPQVTVGGSGHASLKEGPDQVSPTTGEDLVKVIYSTAHKTSASDLKSEGRRATVGEYIVQEADRVFVPDTASKAVEDWAKKRGVVVRFRKGADPAANEIDMTPQAKQAFVRDFTPPSGTEN